MNGTEPTNRYGVEVSLSTLANHSLPSMCFWTSCNGQLTISDQQNRTHLELKRTSKKASISEVPEISPASAIDDARGKRGRDLGRK